MTRSEAIRELLEINQAHLHDRACSRGERKAGWRVFIEALETLGASKSELFEMTSLSQIKDIFSSLAKVENELA
jgi:hypothetical protein